MIRLQREARQPGEVRKVDNAELTDTVNKLKEQIIKIEAGNNDLSETDTRQGLINPLFRSLGWDFRYPRDWLS